MRFRLVALLRSPQATDAREPRYLDPERVEREVYEKLYGERSGNVSAPVPVEPPPKPMWIVPALTRPQQIRARGLPGDPERGTRIDEGPHSRYG